MVKRLFLDKLSIIIPVLALGAIGQSSFAATIGGQLVSATVIFTDPTGTVNATASIPVNLSLSLSLGSAALATNASGGILGLTLQDISPFLNSTFGVNLATDSLKTNLNVFFQCAGTFTSSCLTGPPYDMGLNRTQPSFAGPANFNLQPGHVTTNLYGTFTPTGGTAPAGTYTLPNAGVIIQVFDLSLQGNPIIASITLAEITGPAFTRTVLPTANPEPATWAMMLGGLVFAGRAARRKASPFGAARP